MGELSASASAVVRADRFEWFREAVSTDVMPLSIRTERPSGFRAEITDLRLGPVQLSTFSYSPVVARRSAAHVRKGDPEQYQLALITHGAIRTSQLGNESLVSGDLVLTDTSRPMENESGGDGAGVDVVMLRIPHSDLPFRPDKVDGLLARPIPARAGTGAILAGFLVSLLDQRSHCGPGELPRMGHITLDLARACIAQQLGTPGEAPAEARTQLMRQRVHRFIEDNLGDPDLTPQQLADRHHISLRSLHLLYRDQPLSVAAHIRRARLERARGDLARPELRGLPIQAIAARWGFTSATAFSRAFRDAYGSTPTEHRASALSVP
ncbi:AraC-like ligand-binding domain-containing protein [Kitasatospora purpeofusca]|uniref:AraC-like ligand-binding domain-containing protein n=1 Tax=Kitasatospora purpeofusca TaxID=67352 RepID=UPI0004BEB5AE|nr:helix-turn-helix domain-containing protein [Kitasatospora purpeofusca]